MPYASMSGSRHVGRVLADVRQDIDNFLDPAVLTLVEPRSQSAVEVAALQASDTVIANSELRLQLLGLQGETDTLLAKYEDARRDADTLRLQNELRASRDAQELAKLQQQCDERASESKEKKRRVQQVEAEKELLRCERDALKGEQESARGRFDEALETFERNDAEKRRLEAELQCLRGDLAAMTASRDSLAARAEKLEGEVTIDAIASTAETDRIASLEQEIARLQLEREQTALDKQLASELRQKHKEYEDELSELRAAKAELIQMRAHALKLEQEETTLRAALEARGNALREAEALAAGAMLAKRDLAAFVAAATSIISDPTGEAATPRDLSLAWSKLQSEVSTLHRDRVESQKNLEETLQREQHGQTEIRQLRTSLAAMQASSEELKLDLRKAQDESATLNARISVLREALAKRGIEGGSSTVAVAGDVLDLQTQLGSVKKQSEHLEAVAKVKQTALDSIGVEFESLRREHSKLLDVEAKARHLQQTNENLRQSNAELASEQQRLLAEINSAKQAAALANTGSVTRGFDPSTTNVLHLQHGRGAAFAATNEKQESESLRAELAAVQKELNHLRVVTPAGDLECSQASRQLERFKQVTKKYVMDYREGMYGLLGWKTEMKGDGNSLNWHLTSRYHDDQELIFQLRQGDANSFPEFDLLSTPWGEQLQTDRDAMVFLERYRSIPGFLAHITTDLLARHSSGEA